MADDKKPTLYEELRNLVGTIEGYKQRIDSLKQQSDAVNSAAEIALENGAEEAAQTLASNNSYTHHLEFLVAGAQEKEEEMNEKFVKNRGNLENILGDNQVSKLVPSLLFSYEPKSDDSNGYADAIKLHKKLTPMRKNLSKFNQEGLSRAEDDSLFSEMAQEVISGYEKNYSKKPAIFRALASLAGAVLDKDGNVVKKDSVYRIGRNKPINKEFVSSRYERLTNEKTIEFYKAIGAIDEQGNIDNNKVASYIAKTLPEKSVYDFYKTIVGAIESSKKK